MNVTLLFRLLSAHLLADFFLQNDKLCKAKNESGKKGVIAQLAHAFIHALSAYILLADWKNWIIPLVIFVSHLIIDVLKSRLHGKGTVAFLCDQSVHIFVIVLLWWWLYADNTQAYDWLASMISSKQLWAAIVAYLIITKPASYKDMGEDIVKQRELSSRADAVFALTFKRPYPASYEVTFTPFVKK